MTLNVNCEQCKTRFKLYQTVGSVEMRVVTEVVDGKPQAETLQFCSTKCVDDYAHAHLFKRSEQ